MNNWHVAEWAGYTPNLREFIIDLGITPERYLHIDLSRLLHTWDNVDGAKVVHFATTGGNYTSVFIVYVDGGRVFVGYHKAYAWETDPFLYQNPHTLMDIVKKSRGLLGEINC